MQAKVQATTESAFSRVPTKGTVYAIAFDLSMEALEVHYSATSPQNAYRDIFKVLEPYGFLHTQGSVYLGSGKVNAVTVFQAVNQLTTRYPWFAMVVRDVRMLRIEENNDLLPVIVDIAAGRP